MDEATRRRFIEDEYTRRGMLGSYRGVLYLEVSGRVYIDEVDTVKGGGGRNSIGRAYRVDEVLPVYPRGDGELPGEVRDRLAEGSLFRGCQRRYDYDDDGDLSSRPSVQHNCTMVKFDDTNDTRMEGTMTCLLILFMVFLLSFGSWLFTVIAKRLAVEPIERMLAVVDIVSISLHSFQRDGNKYGESSKKRKKKKKKRKTKEEETRKTKQQAGDFDWDEDEDEEEEEEEEEDEEEDEEEEYDTTFETGFLEEAVLKMAELLHMGYGAAGTEIIQRNLGLSDGTAVETFIAGKKLDACFAFCDIRKFTDTTEVN
jgi:hypothetical protein